MEQEKARIQPKINKDINLSLGQSKTEKKWKNKTMSWAEFLDRLNTPTVTQETAQDYQKMSKSQRDTIKDVGGYVGGFLDKGRRRADSVRSRSIVTLDADSPRGDLWEDVQLLFDGAAAVYSTHSHAPDKPRLRLIIPLSRPVTAEEYQPLARKLADQFGMDNFDDTTYQPERLMFWPSHSFDAEYIFEYQDGAWADPDEYLALYPDWTDSSYWPESSRGHSIRERQAKKQGDPTGKGGVIGAFCRTYNIHSAIEKFLPDVYAPSSKDDRYTYLEGSTSGGLVLYGDKFAYSHHGTDPVGDKLSNAFDLVRVHKFGDQDENVKDHTPINKYPSFKMMTEFAKEDPIVRGLIATEAVAKASTEFDVWEEEDKEWTARLEVDDRGAIETSAGNLELILGHDPNLRKKIIMDKFANRIVVQSDLPWRKVGEERFWKDTDDAGLRVYLEKTYTIAHKGKTEDAFMQEVEKNSVHPVREYLDSLEWDGVERLDNLLIDHLGAANTTYVKMVTRKFLAAAVARIYRPGIKFDYMIVTTGPQGIGKTLLPTKLAGEWFSNSLEGVSGKDSYEALQGVWIMEMGEMTATKKADLEATKHFISKQEDIFRVAYGRHKSYFKRQCVFWGTSNDSEFLRDKTGNRRFWPVDVGINEIKHKVWEMTQETINQIWAEAKAVYEGGERIYLTEEEEKLAVEQQELHTEVSSLEGMINEYLGIPITEDWYDLGRNDRKQYISDFGEGFSELGEVRRDKISVIEVWYELLGGDPKSIHPAKAAEIRSILANMSGWKKYKKSKGQLRFGKDYGRQSAYIREV
ncbi:virulence-associated E family protein [Enterococcus sp. 5H]|uniref:virulence-associated E family protein n=1 Tax=Enterococcus sp. 5H TaxID=1229490 RepID=UPI0023024879|nr:virulence-associated E family protein [Enterococcus sp. 5H]MDA9472659.1 DNA primase, phage associated [Enterococcus sp. 5H]